jgi:hypothetical protein
MTKKRTTKKAVARKIPPTTKVGHSILTELKILDKKLALSEQRLKSAAASKRLVLSQIKELKKAYNKLQPKGIDAEVVDE